MAASKKVITRKTDFAERLKKKEPELKWLYMELYQGAENDYKDLILGIKKFYDERDEYLKVADIERENNPGWYLDNKLVGMMMYTENFAGTLKGVEDHLDYIKKSGVNYLHLMPLLDTTEGKSDGGYAVKDYRKVREDLGNMDDLESLTRSCHENDICVCLDYVMNHTSEDHEWARRAFNGEREYQDMYYFYDNYDIPEQFERTVPQVFPKTAPGNFTYLPELNKYVMTSFYPYQWDLNYWNPRVFNEMMFNMLFLANKGIDVIRIDAVPYIWKELGTNCRNLPKVHTIVRMTHLIAEIVAPGVLLLGEVVMEPKELAPYFGDVMRPECHMLYNATTMCTLWHTVATKDVRLLKYQTDQVASLPKTYSFINYIRCHDDIGWGLDFNFLKGFGMEEVSHKKFLNDYFLGKFDGSVSVGELYNSDPLTGDARFCATSASMCGIERGGFENNADKVSTGIDLDLMLHAFVMFQSGVPVIYSGDEIGAVNDWTYKEDPLKVEDSRYIHRGKFNWGNAEKIDDKDSVESRVHKGMLKLLRARRSNSIFNSDADVYTIETGNNHVLGMIRIKGDTKVIGLYNFSDNFSAINVKELSDGYKDFFLGKKRYTDTNIVMKPYEFMWLKSV